MAKGVSGLLPGSAIVRTESEFQERCLRSGTPKEHARSLTAGHRFLETYRPRRVSGGSLPEEWHSAHRQRRSKFIKYSKQNTFGEKLIWPAPMHSVPRSQETLTACLAYITVSQVPTPMSLIPWDAENTGKNAEFLVAPGTKSVPN